MELSSDRDSSQGEDEEVMEVLDQSADATEIWEVMCGVTQTGSFAVGARFDNCPMPGLVVNLPEEIPPQPSPPAADKGKEKLPLDEIPIDTDGKAQEDDVQVTMARPTIKMRLGLPLGKWERERLAARCEQAPFGRREATIYDRSVRNTLQLAPSAFQLENLTAWNQWLSHTVLPFVKDGLGLSAATPIGCELYKMLLYEKGCFFKPHRDTEKADRMFATLVIVLPSDYTGGELIVRHAGKEVKFDYAAASSYSYQVLAFYADCEHEILPITSGHRLCLVYNVIFMGHGVPPLPFDQSFVANQLQRAIHNWASKRHGKAVLMLEHKYSQAGLTVQDLKNPDRAMVTLLLQAIRQDELAEGIPPLRDLARQAIWNHKINWRAVAHLLPAEVQEMLTKLTKTLGMAKWDVAFATLEVNETGGVDDWYGGNEMIDPDRTITLSSWRNLDGSIRYRELRKMHLDPESELLQGEEHLDDLDWDYNEVEEDTGNEGATAERWYRRAALVFWPRECTWDLICSNELGQACRILKNNLTGISSEYSLPECYELARSILRQRSKELSRTNYYYDSFDLSSLIVGLQLLNDAELAKQFLSVEASRTNRVVTIEAFKSLLSLCNSFGWDLLAADFLKCVESSISLTREPVETLKFVEAIHEASQAHPDNEHLTALLKKTVRSLIEILRHHRHSYGYYGYGRDTGLLSLFRSLISLGDQDTTAQAAKAVLANNVPIPDILLPTIRSLKGILGATAEQNPWFIDMWKACVVYYQQPREGYVGSPNSWTITPPDALERCCGNCRELATFLRHPQLKSHSFRIVTQGRRHIETQVRMHVRDMVTCTTVRKGSPYQLECTKVNGDYAKKMQERQSRLAVLNELLAMLPAQYAPQPPPEPTPPVPQPPLPTSSSSSSSSSSRPLVPSTATTASRQTAKRGRYQYHTTPTHTATAQRTPTASLPTVATTTTTTTTTATVPTASIAPTAAAVAAARAVIPAGAAAIPPGRQIQLPASIAAQFGTNVLNLSPYYGLSHGQYPIPAPAGAASSTPSASVPLPSAPVATAAHPHHLPPAPPGVPGYPQHFLQQQSQHAPQSQPQHHHHQQGDKHVEATIDLTDE